MTGGSDERMEGWEVDERKEGWRGRDWEANGLMVDLMDGWADAWMDGWFLGWRERGKDDQLAGRRDRSLSGGIWEE